MELWLGATFFTVCQFLYVILIWIMTLRNKEPYFMLEYAIAVVR